VPNVQLPVRARRRHRISVFIEKDDRSQATARSALWFTHIGLYGLKYPIGYWHGSMIRKLSLAASNTRSCSTCVRSISWSSPTVQFPTRNQTTFGEHGERNSIDGNRSPWKGSQTRVHARTSRSLRPCARIETEVSCELGPRKRLAQIGQQAPRKAVVEQ